MVNNINNSDNHSLQKWLMRFKIMLNNRETKKRDNKVIKMVI